MASRSKTGAWIMIIIGLILLWVAYIYFTHQTGQLPSFFPGHVTGGTGTHTKHGLAALILGILALIYAWFQMGPKKADSKAASETVESERE